MFKADEGKNRNQCGGQKTVRREAWHILGDSLCKSGQKPITMHQACADNGDESADLDGCHEACQSYGLRRRQRSDDAHADNNGQDQHGLGCRQKHADISGCSDTDGCRRHGGGHDNEKTRCKRQLLVSEACCHIGRFARRHRPACAQFRKGQCCE